jgi:hypothetical protein
MRPDLSGRGAISMDSKIVRGSIAGACVVLALACSNNNSGGSGVSSCASPGAAAQGPADSHCGGTIQVVDPAACSAGDDGGATGDDGGATGDDGGATGDDGGGGDAGDIGNCNDPGFGATMYGNSGADDDCKYDVSWTSDPICENQNVYFTVTVAYRSDHTPVTGANAQPDVALNCTHIIPNHPAETSPEISPGVYRVGPIVFDLPGRWVFRFHFFETCNDSPDSPHGHAAFYLDVP